MKLETRFGEDNYCKTLKRPGSRTEQLKQRVEIAKDVLSMIAAKRLTPINGQYLANEADGFRNQFDDWLFLAEKEYSEALGEEEKDYEAAEAAVVAIDKPVMPPEHASACFIGSVFVAALDRHDALFMGDLETPGDLPTDEDMIGYLEPWWDEEDLRLMETIFECSNWDNLKEIDDPETDPDDRKIWLFKRNALEKSKAGITNAEATLEAILNNIIENKGELVL